MIDVRLLTLQEILENGPKLEHFMYMVMSENHSYKITDEMCKKHYEDMKLYIVDGSAILIGAFDGNELIGFHWGYERNTPGGKRIHSYFNAIEPDYRGQGIGKRFWKILEREAIKRGIFTIEAMCTYSNKTAVNYHLHNGFEIERLQVVKSLRPEPDIR